MFRIRIPATSANLGPGFDSLGMALKVYNEFIFRETAGELEIRLRTAAGQPVELPLADNYLYLALKRLYELEGRELPGLAIQGILSIPLARGLGSSATAIIAGLVAANHLLDYPLSETGLLKLALELEGHPDNIVPAYKGGFTINVLHGEELAYKKIVPPEGLKIAAAVPEIKLKTAELRAVLPDRVPLQDAVFNQSRTALLAVSLAEGDWDRLALAMEDRLHQNYRGRVIPGFRKAVAAAYRAGARGAALSGAGPTVIALTDQEAEGPGKAMVEAFAAEGIAASYLVTGIDNCGLRFEQFAESQTQSK